MKGVGPPGPVDPLFSRPELRLETPEPRPGPELGTGPEQPGGPGRLLGPKECWSPMGPSKEAEEDPGPAEEEEDEDDGIKGPDGGPLEATGLEWSEPPNGEW